MNAEPYQPKVGDTVWIATTGYHISGIVAVIAETTLGNLYTVTSKHGNDHFATKVYPDEMAALKALIAEVQLTLSVAQSKLAWLESQAAQAAQPQPLAA